MDHKQTKFTFRRAEGTGHFLLWACKNSKMGVIFGDIEERTRQQYWLPHPTVIQAVEMRLTNRMISEFRNLGYGLHEQFELSFRCFMCGAPGVHFLLDSEILI